MILNALREFRNMWRTVDHPPLSPPWAEVAPYVASWWASDTLNAEAPTEHGENRRLVETPEEANLTSSWTADGHHVAIDIDLPCHLERSASGVHGHLYATLKRPVSWDELEEFLVAAVKIGLVDQRYLDHSRARNMTMLRRPGIAKVVAKFRGGISGY